MSHATQRSASSADAQRRIRVVAQDAGDGVVLRERGRIFAIELRGRLVAGRHLTSVDWSAIHRSTVRRDVVVDLRALEQLDAAGLEVLAGIRRAVEARGRRVRFVGASGRIDVMLRLTGLAPTRDRPESRGACVETCLPSWRGIAPDRAGCGPARCSTNSGYVALRGTNPGGCPEDGTTAHWAPRSAVSCYAGQRMFATPELAAKIDRAEGRLCAEIAEVASATLRKRPMHR